MAPINWYFLLEYLAALFLQNYGALWLGNKIINTQVNYPLYFRRVQFNSIYHKIF